MPLYTEAPDATANQRGKIKLANELAGTADAPRYHPSVRFNAYVTTGVSATASTWVKVNLNTEEYDTANAFDTTNFRFVAPVKGIYMFQAQVGVGSGSKRLLCQLRKNGVEWKRGADITGPALRSTIVASLGRLEVGDYVELWVYQTVTSNITSGLNIQSYMNGVLIGVV